MFNKNSNIFSLHGVSSDEELANDFKSFSVRFNETAMWKKPDNVCEFVRDTAAPAINVAWERFFNKTISD